MLSIWTSLKICLLVKCPATFHLKSAIAFSLVQSKILSFGKGLKKEKCCLPSVFPFSINVSKTCVPRKECFIRCKLDRLLSKSIGTTVWRHHKHKHQV